MLHKKNTVKDHNSDSSEEVYKVVDEVPPQFGKSETKNSSVSKTSESSSRQERKKQINELALQRRATKFKFETQGGDASLLHLA